MTRQSAKQQERENAARLAQELYDAQKKFQGPLVDRDHLPSKTPYTPKAGVKSHWVAPPPTTNLASRWGRDAAIAMLSVAPSEWHGRQDMMVMVANDALAAQVRSLGGTIDWLSPEWRAIAIFWETIIRFAEPGVTLPWLMKWKDRTDKHYDELKACDDQSDISLAKLRAKEAKKQARRLARKSKRRGRAVRS